MKQFLRPLILLVSVCFMLAQATVVFADGKSDPLSIVSEAERIISDEQAAPAEVVDGQVEGKPEIEVQDEVVAEEDSPYLIGPSDKLRVTVYGENDLSKVYQVDGLGMVSVPLIGQVKVAGLTLRQAESLLVLALSNGYIVDPSVAIEVAEFRPFYIMGEVRRPGSYNFIDGMSVLNAVAISGGFTYRANTKNIEVIRSGADGNAMVITPTSQVMPGDIIRVKERFF